MSDPLVSASWLAGRLGAADIQVVDATWFMPGDPRSGRAEYEAGHIPGAVFFDIDAISDQDSDLPHMLPSPEQTAAALSALGLSRDAHVVVYDGQGIFSAPRAWWHLRTAGFDRVSVLDGGLRVWRAEGRSLETGQVQPRAGALDATHDESLVRDVGAVRQALADGSAQLVDARAAARFTGDAPEPRAGLPSGHMPGARNLPWNALIDVDGTLKDAPALRAAFDAAGVDVDGPIITTCGSGVSAAILSLGLARLGRGDVPIYDGSWTEWASRTDTEIATGG